MVAIAAIEYSLTCRNRRNGLAKRLNNVTWANELISFTDGSLMTSGCFGSSQALNSVGLLWPFNSFESTQNRMCDSEAFDASENEGKSSLVCKYSSIDSKKCWPSKGPINYRTPNHLKMHFMTQKASPLSNDTMKIISPPSFASTLQPLKPEGQNVPMLQFRHLRYRSVSISVRWWCCCCCHRKLHSIFIEKWKIKF